MADLERFFAAFGPKKTACIGLAVMDMWKPFRNSVTRYTPEALIIFDKFHVMLHLNDALDEVRRSEYRRLAGEEPSHIKGNRYLLLSSRENLSLWSSYAQETAHCLQAAQYGFPVQRVFGAALGIPY